MNRNRKSMDTQRVPNRDINAGNRVVAALALRAQKLTYEEIAQRTGYGSPSSCRKAVIREMDRCVVRNVGALRDEELFILDSLHAAVWPLVFPNDSEQDEDEEEPARKKAKPKVNLFAVDRLLAISEARRKLMGLDIPVDQAQMNNITVIREVPQGYLTPAPAPEVIG